MPSNKQRWKEYCYIMLFELEYKYNYWAKNRGKGACLKWLPPPSPPLPPFFIACCAGAGVHLLLGSSPSLHLSPGLPGMYAFINSDVLHYFCFK